MEQQGAPTGGALRPAGPGPAPRPRTCADLRVLQHHAVVDEADVLGGVAGLGPLLAQQVQDARGQHGELTVLDELAQVG